MASESWLSSSLALPDLDVRDPGALLERVARAIAQSAGLAEPDVERVLRDALAREGWSLGAGVAIPHTELAGVTQPVVALAVTRAPLALPSIDQRAPDVFFFILAPPEDPEGHLLLLARLARLAQSHTLLAALRKAKSNDDLVALVSAAELRHDPMPAGRTSSPGFERPPHALIVIAIAGEKAADALLVELLDRGKAEATIVEAQSVREATTREVPLFAGFQDIFGDPGGRRVILVEADAGECDALLELVRKIAEERRALEVHVNVLPVHRRWQLARASDEESESGGHA